MPRERTLVQSITSPSIRKIMIYTPRLWGLGFPLCPQGLEGIRRAFERIGSRAVKMFYWCGRGDVYMVG